MCALLWSGNLLAQIHLGCLRMMPGRSGQAPALSIPQWKLWLEWLGEHAGPPLPGGAGLEGGEDICLSAATPMVVIAGHTPGWRKSPGEVYVRKHHLGMMRAYLRTIITTSRTQGHKHGKAHWDIPQAGYIFSSRTKASKGHLHYQAMHSAVRREANLCLQRSRSSGHTVDEPPSSQS